MDVNEHEKVSNCALRHTFMQRNWAFIGCIFYL